jgi:hypothetical protein
MIFEEFNNSINSSTEMMRNFSVPNLFVRSFIEEKEFIVKHFYWLDEEYLLRIHSFKKRKAALFRQPFK